MRLDRLDKLRARIKQIEGTNNAFKAAMETPTNSELHRKKGSSLPGWSLGLSAIDHLFPGGISPHGLHEITPAHYQDSWVALSFTLALLSRRVRHDKRSVLWCSSSLKRSEFGNLYGHGLHRFNLDPTRFILIETRNDSETAFVLEEALKSNHLCAVLGQLDGLNLTLARRLSLIAGKGRTPALLITKPGNTGIQTALTRWNIAKSPPAHSAFAPQSDIHQSSIPLLSRPPLSWQVSLLRNRQGPADQKWHLEFPKYDPPLHKWAKKAFRFAHPSPFRNRKSPAFNPAKKVA